jgi:cell division protein FtsL
MTLLFGLLFGAVGTVYFVYGKRTHEPMFLVVGFALVIYPYFVTNVALTLLIGAILAAIPIARHKGLI